VQKRKNTIGMKRAAFVLEIGLFIVCVMLLYISSYLYNAYYFPEQIILIEPPCRIYQKTVMMLEYAFMTLAIVSGGSILYLFTE